MGLRNGIYPGNPGATPRLLQLGPLSRKTKISSSKTIDIKDAEYFKCHKKGKTDNKYSEAKAKDGKVFFKVKQLEESSIEEKDEKSIRKSESDILISIVVILTPSIRQDQDV